MAKVTSLNVDPKVVLHNVGLETRFSHELIVGGLASDLTSRRDATP